jgi:hypothetical protein
MAIGWRMGDDLELLAELPSGTIHFDILEGRSAHNIGGNIDLRIASEMKDWLLDRLSKDGIPIEVIQTATLEAGMNTERIKTDKKRIVSFDWRCRSSISTDEKTYQGEWVDRHVWHSRLQTQSTKVRDSR